MLWVVLTVVASLFVVSCIYAFIAMAECDDAGVEPDDVPIGRAFGATVSDHMQPGEWHE